MNGSQAEVESLVNNILSHSPSRDSIGVSDVQFMSVSRSATDIRSSSTLTEPGSNASKHHSMCFSESGQILSPPWLPKSTRSGSSVSTSLLVVPSEKYGYRRLSGSSGFNKFSNDILFEEESDIIRNCGALSSAVLGLMKSFSTTDISTTLDPLTEAPVRSASSELALFGGILWNSKLELPTIRRLDACSRSCSTWVAVGDPICFTSQLPSPQTQTAGSESAAGQLSPTITPTELLQSVNKKVRQMYIRRRLLSTYRALERLSRSQLDISNVVRGDLEFLTSSPAAFHKKPKSATSATSPAASEQAEKAAPAVGPGLSQVLAGDAERGGGGGGGGASLVNDPTSRSFKRNKSANRLSNPIDLRQLTNEISTLSIKDIDLQKGKPLTKYERNIMIFNWLQNLDQEDLMGEPLANF